MGPQKYSIKFECVNSIRDVKIHLEYFQGKCQYMYITGPYRSYGNVGLRNDFEPEGQQVSTWVNLDQDDCCRMVSLSHDDHAKTMYKTITALSNPCKSYSELIYKYYRRPYNYGQQVVKEHLVSGHCQSEKKYATSVLESGKDIFEVNIYESM